MIRRRSEGTEEDDDTSEAVTIASYISYLTMNKRKEVFDRLQETLKPLSRQHGLDALARVVVTPEYSGQKLGRSMPCMVPFTFSTPLMQWPMNLHFWIVVQSENFIDVETWKRMGIGQSPLVKPIKVYNVGGTENK